MRRAHRLSLLLVGVALCGAAPARAVRDAERAHAAQETLRREAAEQARAAEAEEGRLAQQRIAAAARMRSYEAKVGEAAAEIEALATRRRDAEQRLAERAAAFAPLLPLIERLALYPAETMLAVPAPPQDTLRGLAVLRGLARRLEQDAATLRAEQATVQALENDIAAALPRLQAAQAAQASQAAELDRQIEAARAPAGGVQRTSPPMRPGKRPSRPHGPTRCEAPWRRWRRSARGRNRGRGTTLSAPSGSARTVPQPRRAGARWRWPGRLGREWTSTGLLWRRWRAG